MVGYRRAMLALGLMGGGLTLIGCPTGVDHECTVSAVIVVATPTDIDVGGQSTLTAAPATDCDGKDLPTTSWSASGSGVLTLSATTGNTITVTGLAAGTAILTATAKGTSGQTSVSVTPRPRILLSRTLITFTVAQNAALPAAQTFSVTNGGGGTLNGVSAVENITYGPGATGWLSGGVGQFGTTAPVTVSVLPNTTSLPPATYTATIPVTAPLANNTPQSVTVSYQVTQPSGFQLSIGASGNGTGTVTAPTAGGQPAIACNISGSTTSGQCTGTYPQATQLTLTAQATGGSTFTGWTGACTGAQCVVGGVTGAVIATASFASTPGSIALSLNPNSASVPQGGAVATTATLTRGGSFTGTVTFSVTGVPAGTTATVSNVVTNGTITTATVTFFVGVGTTAGTYSPVVVGSGAGVADAQAIFTLTVTGASAIQLSPNPLTGLAMAGGTAQVLNTVSITSSGNQITGLSFGPITYGPGGTNWISEWGISPLTTPAAGQVVVNPATLGVGTFSATFPVSGNGVATQNLTVTLTVVSAASGTIVFERYSTGLTDTSLEVWRMNANGSGQVQLTNNAVLDGRPSLSPNGSQIAFRSDRTGNPEIWLMANNGSSLQQITNTASSESFPAWINNAFIAYSSADPANPAIQNILFAQVGIMACPVGACPTSSVSNGASNAWPAASPTSNVIAYGSNIGTGTSVTEIWTYNWTTAAVQNLSNSTTANEIHPAYSPNGTKIAFASRRSGGGSGSFQIWVMDANGANKLQLTTLGQNYDPVWSPDGTRIAFISERTGVSQIFIMNADGNNQVNITNSGLFELRFSWR